MLDEQWVERLRHFNHLVVGFSGGLDSTVLLHMLASHPVLAKKVRAVHIHHGLSQHATHWQASCRDFCATYQLELITHNITLPSHANLEEEARNARLRVFSSVLEYGDCLLLAHHQDDQLETILLQLCRGTGLDGFTGMAAYKPFLSHMLARPLLSYSRHALKAYAMHYDLTWIEDESNENVMFSRNYLRQQVIPLLKKKWPNLEAVASRNALHLQHAQMNLEELAILDCPALTNVSGILVFSSLMHLSSHRLDNVLRVWLSRQQIKLPSTKTFERLRQELIFARQDATPCVQWGDISIRRYRDTLYVSSEQQFLICTSFEWSCFPHPIQISDRCSFIATPSTNGILIPVHSRVEVRFRIGGETLVLHGKTRTLKKLFQTWGVAPWLRDTIPLIYVDDKLVAVLGFFECSSEETHDGNRYIIERSVSL